MLRDNRLAPASQTAAFYCGLIAYDDDYTETADALEEGERLARLMAGKPIVFMKNHGLPMMRIVDRELPAYRD